LITYLHNTIKRFSTCRKGATAIEFAIVAPVFFALIFAIFELGLLYLRISLLDNATSEIAKAVYIGNVTSDPAAEPDKMSVDDIELFICNAVGLVVPTCARDISVELTQIDTLSDLPETDAQCADSTRDFTASTQFNPGAASTNMFMRVCITTDLVAPFVYNGLGLTLPEDAATGRFLIISSIAFRNEPFS